ncbi:hypothetical protein AB6805_27965 [Chitinophaga sp. RCC_12]|uniref:hypothetical protein n=1 Tax=Chitinophaga sp. RCC_12 TaxID=3239226 RepID=UPI003524E1FD
MSNPVEIRGNTAVRNLRQAKLSNGRPFMINSKELPAHQCYFEYPGGKISLMTLAPNNRDFLLIRDLSNKEAAKIREQYNLE